MPQFSHASYRLHPAKDFFHPLALLLADRVTRMPCRPSVNRARASLIVLRHVRSGGHVPRLFDKIFGVVSFIGSNGNWLIPWDLSIITSAASRSAVPLSCNTSTSATNPLRSPSTHARYSSAWPPSPRPS